MACRIKKFTENTSTIPEVMDSSTLNFKPNFKFARFLGGGVSPVPPYGGDPRKTPAPLRVCIKSREDTPTSLKVIESNPLNFRPYF